MDKKPYPPFSLSRLLKTVFDPRPGEKIGILIDLPNLSWMAGAKFLAHPELAIQRHAHEVFYLGLRQGVMAELGLAGGELFAYQITGGSNLDLPDRAVALDGRELSLARDIYPAYQILLCVSTFSATAPLTAFARRYGFRGATLHGLNDIVLRTGLSVDYFEVSRDAEKLRLGLTRADYFEIDFQASGRSFTLRLDCSNQEAQKSHGLCRDGKPDIANLPAGEVYFVPTGAEGDFPMRYEDGTLGLMTVQGGRISRASLLSGRRTTIDAHNLKLASDPVTGEIGELGFGTQALPVSGRDIQDEKILGTLHVATGRSDHLGGKLTPDKFTEASHATHDDILFSPSKTPEILVTEARAYWPERCETVIRNYEPSPYLLGLLAAAS